MDIKKVNQIINDNAYTRTGGTAEELKCAEYIKAAAAELTGYEAHIEDFEVDMSTMNKAVLLIDGKEIPCKGYLCSGNADIEAPFYYMPSDDKHSLAACKGKIVMIDSSMSYWKYQDIVEKGAVGFITYDGNANYADEDIDQKELRKAVSNGNKIPGVCINAKQAIALVRDGATTAKIILDQEEYVGTSRNVVLDIPGEIEDTIVVTAHYDSTSLSQGSYDNMSGSIGLLGIAEHFAKAPHRYSLRFVWCGSEERGLLGSKAYVAAHEDELSKFVLNVNLDMIGCIMGGFAACCTCEDKLVTFIEYLSYLEGFPLKVWQDVYSSDSTPFADKGVPAVSFARHAPQNTATIHNRYDTPAVMKAEHVLKDIDFINAFIAHMANAKNFPVAREIPANVKDKLDVYLNRKRGGGRPF